MQRYGEDILHSASDVVNFLECEDICYLDRIDLVTSLPRAAEDDQARLVQEKGYAHEAAYDSSLVGASASFIDIAQGRRSLDGAATLSCSGREERCKRLCHAAGCGRHEAWAGGLDHLHQMETAFPARGMGRRVAGRPVPDVRLCAQLRLRRRGAAVPDYAALGAQGGTRASYRLQTPVRTQGGFGAARIRTATIDLSDLKSVPNQLLALFPDQAEDAEAA